MSVTEPAQASTTPIIEPPSVEEMIKSYDWDYDIALAIAKCESSLNAGVVNDNPATRDYSVGIFQINLYGDNAFSRPSEEWLKVPANNVYYAHQLYLNGGWGHWRNCLNKGLVE